MGFKISPILQEHMCRMGSKLPFDESAEEMEQMLRIDVNAKQIERLSHCYGEQIDQVNWELSHQQGVQLKIKEQESNPVYCMADGSMLLTREDKWKEIKLGRIFSQSSHITDISKDRAMITDSMYCAHFGKSDKFWDLFSKEIPNDRKLVFICDGAKWLWNHIEDYYPDSVQILDYYHCKEHICQFAKEYYKKPIDKTDFIDQIMEYLTNQKVDIALSTIEALPCLGKVLQKKKAQLHTYLTNNQKRINYGKYKEDGLLIGSGPIEAANRDVIQKRMKLSGQRWTLKGAQQIVNLRVLLKSNRWNEVINLINGCQEAA